jgi:hypothetical protein
VVSCIWQKNKSLEVKDTVKYLWRWNCLSSFLFRRNRRFCILGNHLQANSLAFWSSKYISSYSSGATCLCYWLLLMSWSLHAFRGYTGSRYSFETWRSRVRFCTRRLSVLNNARNFLFKFLLNDGKASKDLSRMRPQFRPGHVSVPYYDTVRSEAVYWCKTAVLFFHWKRQFKM